ncbi:MAG: O-antigen ligase family protein, partial [Candidatus Yanofskybacteria bacterium]|nr:O-antigen ligase family protein [Candidatus Yanofskybacteria bacterium]
MERAIFYFLVFSIPVQARIILFEWTRPFNQWVSAYLYGTDILIGTIFILWLIRSGRTVSRTWNAGFFRYPIFNIKYFGFWLAIFFAIAGLSIAGAQFKALAWYQLLKLTEFVGFYFYLKDSLGKIFSFHGALLAIIASGFIQALLAIFQYLKQGSVGLRMLGESPLSANTTGVAIFVADGERYIRAYGLTPHPNILAAWLFMAIFALYHIYVYRSGDTDVREWRAGSREKFIYGKTSRFLLPVYAVILLGFFFTFSRIVIGLWALGVLLWLLIIFLKKDFRENMVIRRGTLEFLAVSFIVAVFFSGIFWPQVKSRLAISANDLAVTERIFYNKAATDIAEDKPWLGVGLGQFIPEMMQQLKKLPSHAYQPVHNVYLLLASETGFVGLGAFLSFIFFVFWDFFKKANFRRFYNFSFVIFSISFLAMGLFDHFLWTSQ